MGAPGYLPAAPARETAAVHAHHPERRILTGPASTTIRRVREATADELLLVCRPDDASADPARQAETVYNALVEVLASESLGPEALVSETLFLTQIRDDLEAVRAGRLRALERAGLDAHGPATSFIGQPPLSGAALELAAVAVVPHQRASWSARNVSLPLTCPCAGCSPGARARICRLGDQTSLHAGNVYGSGRDAFEQAYAMFCAAEALLGEGSMGFGDVVRTWIYLRDIDRDYDALNKARREFFLSRGIERRPASTGVQGIPFPDEHDVSMKLYAVKSARPLDITVMSTPTLNEAWSYGADFSRGLRLVDADKTALYISGTASVDEAGQTVHAGDFEGQVNRMLHNIASLLAEQKATFEDVVSAVTYLKNPSDAPVLRRMFHERGFKGFPSTLVEAPLCRPELLCEAEAIAILPASRRGA